MLKYIPRSDINLLLHIFNLSWSLHSTSFVTLIHKMRKPYDSLDSFRPIFLTSCVSKLFGRIILSLPFSLPARPVSALNGLLRPLNRSCLLVLFLGRFSLIAHSLLFGTCYSDSALPPLSDSLQPHDLVILTMDLFLFLLEKAALASLPTALSVALRSPFFSGGPVYSSFPLKPAPFCTLFLVSAAPTNLPFLIHSSLTLTTLSSPLSFLLPQYLW